MLPDFRRTLRRMAKKLEAKSATAPLPRKVIVTLTVQEIFDEHIAKKLKFPRQGGQERERFMLVNFS